MNSTRALKLLYTPWSLGITLVVLLGVAIVCYVSWRRRGSRPGDGWLELMRWGLVAYATFLLNQPEFTEEFLPTRKPRVAVVCDVSPSMTTQDVIDESGVALARDEASRRLRDPETWEVLGDALDVQVRTFGAGDERSDLFQSITDTVNQTDGLIGLVLVSDGIWNEGLPPVNAATRMRMNEIPMFAVPVGSPTRLPDVDLVSFDVPRIGVAGKTVRIPFSLESSFPRQRMTEVVLSTDQGDEVRTEVALNPMGRTHGAILWKPSRTGEMMVSLDVQKLPDETQFENNHRVAPIEINQERLRVLLVESYPRWEYRYLRNALSRDPGVELSCLLFHPRLEAVGGGNKDYIKAFPGAIEELGKFDVVFLGDVGIGDQQLTEEDCRLIKGIVEHQASGLVFMPGWQGRQASLMETELSELYPVVLDPAQPDGWGSRTPSHFELTNQGQRSLLTKLADTEQDNQSVWESLPGFQWYAAVERAKPGTEVLCVHRDMSNQYGRIPLLVTRTFGAGKILFMGTDGAWRWRKGVEDMYHYRFWSQVVRWMAYQRNMAVGKSMRMYYSPDQPDLDRTITLNANVMQASGEPLQQGEVVARIVAPSGKSELVHLQSTGSEWGAFSGQFTPHEPGEHQVVLACKQVESNLEASIFVQGVAEERPGQPARPEVLQELARVTQGRVLEVSQIDEIVSALRSLPEPPPSVRRVPLWSHPLVGGLFVILLGVFWVGRKVIGLI